MAVSEVRDCLHGRMAALCCGIYGSRHCVEDKEEKLVKVMEAEEKPSLMVRLRDDVSEGRPWITASGARRFQDPGLADWIVEFLRITAHRFLVIASAVWDNSHE